MGVIFKSVFVVLVSLALVRCKPQRAGTGNKLLYILLDGFRYDYVDLQPSTSLPGFTRFLQEGVRAQWVNPLYPSISYPTWTTLSTGIYAENHNIIGNYFYDPSDQTSFSLFDEQATGMKKWWTEEPIWTTATKAGLRAALYLWSRCDVPYDDILPDTCEKFVKITGKEIFRTNIDKALVKLQEGYDLVQVYTEHTDNTGHNNGPEGEEVRQAVRDLDETIVYLLDQLEQLGLTDQVNIVIVSDHGMTNTSPEDITRIEIDDYLPTEGVVNIADKGAYSIVKVEEGYVDQVYEALTKMEGVDVYRKEDIPEEFHVAEALYMHEILLWAKMGYFIMSSRRDIALPPRNDDYTYYGAHGYYKDEMTMKAIFFAKGPAFQANVTIAPIEIVDVYQVLAHALDIEANPNNGTWANIAGALRSGTRALGGAIIPVCATALLSTFLTRMMF